MFFNQPNVVSAVKYKKIDRYNQNKKITEYFIPSLSLCFDARGEIFCRSEPINEPINNQCNFLCFFMFTTEIRSLMSIDVKLPQTLGVKIKATHDIIIESSRKKYELAEDLSTLRAFQSDCTEPSIAAEKIEMFTPEYFIPSLDLSFNENGEINKGRPYSKTSHSRCSCFVGPFSCIPFQHESKDFAPSTEVVLPATLVQRVQQLYDLYNEAKLKQSELLVDSDFIAAFSSDDTQIALLPAGSRTPIQIGI